MQTPIILTVLAGLLPGLGAQAQVSTDDRVAQLAEQVALLQRTVEQLRAELTEQKRQLATVAPPAQHGYWESAAAPSEPPQPAVADLAKKLDGAIGDLGGFRFGGDFRYRFDVQARSGNAADRKSVV